MAMGQTENPYQPQVLGTFFLVPNSFFNVFLGTRYFLTYSHMIWMGVDGMYFEVWFVVVVVLVDLVLGKSIVVL